MSKNGDEIKFNVEINDKLVNQVNSFINSNFDKENTMSVQLKNFKKLVIYLQKNHILLNEFEVDMLLNKSSKLNSMLAMVIPYLEKNQIEIDDNMDVILEMYKSANDDKNINFEGVENDSYNDNMLFRSKNGTSLDLINLYFQEIKEYKLLTKEEEFDLYQRIKDGDEDAKEALINHNLRLVASIANKYLSTIEFNPSISYTDLIQSGNIGLIKAVEHFDATKGYKFSTYATWWIKQSITRDFCDTGRTVRIPVHVHETLIKIKKADAKLTNELDRKPTTKELAAATGISKAKIEDILKHTANIGSLDVPVGEEEDSVVGDFIESDNNVEDDVLNNEQLSEFAKFFNETNILSVREKDILCLRFGINDGICHTLEEIGKMYNVTRERIRQIISKALRKLKNDHHARTFCSKYDLDEEEHNIYNALNKNAKSSLPKPKNNIELKRQERQKELDEYFASEAFQKQLRLK